MNNQSHILISMLDKIAQALPQEYLDEMAFIGGCTTALFLDIPNAEEGIRATYDVDLIVDISTRTAWYKLEDSLRELGFKNDLDDDILCRFKLNDIIVDFMPINQDILGFTNYWYEKSMKHTNEYILPSNTKIKILDACYFLATKFEAYQGRGNNDPMSSKDIEDILNVVAGRSTIIGEIYDAEPELQDYLGNQFAKLISHADWQYVLQGNVSSALSMRVAKNINAIINRWGKAY
ncbi:hypothetical protein [Acinetobacter indicus]|uniref:hypothetical protein n=1 Tax=Acinetobacter indicus TaxID=756892 RepID=UPI00209AE412|nr:hypothetical protein [Acinetobacter indicus]MCO8089578.1 hypothetical protein [Acinetobacter indicus]